MTLHDAARLGDLAALRKQLAAGARVEAKDEQGQTPLMAAAQAGRVEALRALLEAGANPDTMADPHDPDPKRPPTGAPADVVCRYGLIEWVGPIVRGEVTVKQRRKTQNGPTALMLAAAAGHLEAVAALLDAGASPDVHERDGFTALAYAAALGRPEIVRALIRAGAPVDTIDHYEKTPIILAALGGHADAIRALVEAGAALSATSPSTMGPLHAAAYYGHAEAVRVLLDAGADPGTKAINQDPLGMALNRGYTEVVRALARGGADINGVDWRKLTPLQLAIARRNQEAVRILLDAGADPNAAVGPKEPGLFSGQALPEGATALHLAAALGDPELVSTLLAEGANSRARDTLGFTPLMLATASGHHQAARRLTEAAPPDESDVPTLRSFALVAAVRAGDEPRVRELLDEGAPAGTLIPNTFQYHYLLRCDATDDFFDGSSARGEGSLRDAERPLLSLAIEQGHDAIASALLGAGAGVADDPEQIPNIRPPLILAASQGQRATVSALLAAGADSNAKDAERRTPLIAAAAGGHAKIVGDLIAAGAKLNLKDPEGRTALSAAAEGGHVEILQTLLKAKAKVRPGDLAYAAARGHADAARIVLEAGRAQKVAFEPGTLSQVVWEGPVAMVRFLLDAGFDVNGGDEGDIPALIPACRKSAELVRLLLDAGADVNACDPEGNSALSLATAFQGPDVVRLLLERGADIECRMNGAVRGETPLIRASGYGSATYAGFFNDPAKMEQIRERDAAMIRVLLEHGADLEARDEEEGRTPLLHAAAAGRDGAVRLLLEAGADVDARDAKNGQTALMLAAIDGHEPVVHCLVEAGADVDAEDFDGQTAAELARRAGKILVEPLLRRPGQEQTPPLTPSLARALTEALEAGDADTLRRLGREGADLDATLSGRRTPLMVAVAKGHADAVAALLEAGVDLNARDDEGNTPLFLAIKACNPRMVRLLLQAGADPNRNGPEIEGCGHETPLSAAIGDRSLAMAKAWQDVINGFRDAYALGSEHIEIIRDLITAGADVSALDELGMRPLWYAFDLGQPELADLLIEAGAGDDPVSVAYLEARTFADLALGEPFQELVRSAARLCGATPELLTSRPTHREFLTLRQGGSFPSGPTIGAAFTVPTETAKDLIATHQEELRERGAFLFRAEAYVGNFDTSRQRLGLLPTADKYTVIAARCAAGSNWGWTSPAFYIRDLRAIEPKFPFRLIGCEHRSLQLEFVAPIANVNDLARRLDAIRTHLWAPGLDEQPDVEEIARSLKKRPEIHFGWE